MKMNKLGVGVHVISRSEKKRGLAMVVVISKDPVSGKLSSRTKHVEVSMREGKEHYTVPAVYRQPDKRARHDAMPTLITSAQELV